MLAGKDIGEAGCAGFMIGVMELWSIGVMFSDPEP